jgi:sortase A
MTEAISDVLLSNLARVARALSALMMILAVVLALAGLVLIGQGVWVHAKAALAQVLLDRAFAQALATGEAVKPWSWADTWPVARIEFPRLRKSAIVLSGSSGQAMAFGPGQVERTPVAGEPGTTIYAAHRDTHFDFLGRVAIGDAVTVTRQDGKAVRFRVTGTGIARWDASGIDPRKDDARRLVLATCWPLDGRLSGPLRYLVYAEMVSETADVAR